MHVLQIGYVERDDARDRWGSAGLVSTFVHISNLLPVVSDAYSRRALTADVIVLLVLPNMEETRYDWDDTELVALIRAIRGLPHDVAMPDGRMWKTVPIVSVSNGRYMPHPLFSRRGELQDVDDLEFLDVHADDAYGATKIAAVVRAYRDRILAELDNLGFIVTYEGGRYRLGPALRKREGLTGRYYCGAADRRPSHVITVDRDMFGIQLEAELFEELINRADVTEPELQLFFEEYPHFLSAFAEPLPHVRLVDGSGRLLVPDFILRPIVALQRDSRWQVLDLKRPQAQLLVGKDSRRRFSHEVMAAVRQLRDYGDFFADPRNVDGIQRNLGHALRRPKLGVVIGRLDAAQAEVLELEQSRLADVHVVTYDEILDQQRMLVR